MSPLRILLVVFGSIIGIGLLLAVLVPAPDVRSGPAPVAQATPAPEPTPEPETFSGTSPTCGPVVGQTAQDLANVQTFCGKGIASGAVVGAHATQSLLWLKVSRDMADAMRADSLTTEQLVLTWMRGWKATTGLPSVSVTVEWQDVEIAKGDTTLLSGDKVTLR